MHEHFMRAALHEAEGAFEAGEFPVGCVIVSGTSIVARGRRENSCVANELDHAEIMALRNLHTAFPEGAPHDLRAYVTMEPCLMCFGALLLNGVQSVIFAYEDIMGGGTNLARNQLNPLYAEMEVMITGGVMRNESLSLFQKFFKKDTTGYWRDSSLALYTLSQRIVEDK